ncbi:hypothetical protein D9M73_217970 [compost metagenome]
MFWFLVFAGPCLLVLLGAGMFFNGIRSIWTNPKLFFCWIIGAFCMAAGSGVVASGVLLFDFVFSSIK